MKSKEAMSGVRAESGKFQVNNALQHRQGRAKCGAMAAPFALDRALFRVSGPDARSFLQGMLTQDIDRMEEEALLYAALLSPQGKLLADMFVQADRDGAVLLDAPATRGATLSRRLSMYKLRAQVDVEDISDRFGIVFSEAPFEGARADPRLPSGALGWRKIATRVEASTLADGAQAFERTRLALGVPDLARDCGEEEVFAAEALLEEMHGVDFQKGCYVGQENVSRMKRRATTRRKFCPIVFDGPPLAFGAAVRAGEIDLGTVRTGGPGRALALLRLDRALAALEAGKPLTVDGREVRLDPPAWLILPPREGAASSAPD
jgi:tRNA-modifying protein YgfZ